MLPEEVSVKFHRGNEWMIDPSSWDVDLKLSPDILRRSCKLDRERNTSCLSSLSEILPRPCGFSTPQIIFERLII